MASSRSCDLGTVARPTGQLWSVHHLLRSLRSLRRAGVWAKIMSALAGAHDAAAQMIDTSIIRVHQHGACITRNRKQSMGRSRSGSTSTIYAVVDTNGLPRLALTAGEAHGLMKYRLVTPGILPNNGKVISASKPASQKIFLRKQPHAKERPRKGSVLS
jgi:hypothetical protein